MVFGNRGVNKADIRLNGIMLEKVLFTKFLGVLIDYQLNWCTHIQTTCGKIAKVIGVMFKIKNKIDSATLCMIYNSLILPYLSYCCEIWGNTFVSRLHGLKLLQKRAIRIIGNVSYLDHTSMIFKRFNILKLQDIITLNTCVLMYKANRGSLPKHVQNNFVKNKEIHGYNTRCRNNFYSSQISTRLKKMSVTQKGIDIWNVLPLNTRQCVSLNKFKMCIKKDMLNKY